MTTKKIHRTPAIVAIALAAALVSPAATAFAEEISPASTAQCAAAKFCLWSGVTYSGTFYSTSSSADVQGLSSARAVWNRLSTAVRVYSGASGTGSYVCFAPGTQLPSTALTAGSIRVQSATTC